LTIFSIEADVRAIALDPMVPLAQFAAASDQLYHGLSDMKERMKSYLPFGKKETKSTEVFCSELVALLYKDLNIQSFLSIDPSRYTPLEVEVIPEFDGQCYYVKEHKECLLLENKKVPRSRDPHNKSIIAQFFKRELWMDVNGGEETPKDIPAAGYDTEGVPLYVCRVKIGTSLHPGKAWPEAKKCHVGFQGTELEIKYGYEILTSYEDFEWVKAKDGQVPPNAVEAGVEEDGDMLYVARAFVAKQGFLNFFSGFGSKSQSTTNVTAEAAPKSPDSEASKGGIFGGGLNKAISSLSSSLGNLSFGGKKGSETEVTPKEVVEPAPPTKDDKKGLYPGKVNPSLKGALIAYNGKEALVKEYEVLCKKQ
jgi:hypothetical protein